MDFLPKKLIILGGAFFISTGVLANPVLNNVAAGNVTVTQSNKSTVVNQTSSKAIINWRSFNINAQEKTHFQQPNGGVALNRISPTQGASKIFGQLTATGKIILVNPAGIYFGPTAYVSVGGLIATTANIADKDFLNNKYQFTKVPGYSGAIINEGQIIAAQNGLAALVGPGVVNNGSIRANLGHVVLASGEAFTMNFSGDDLIHFKIDQKTATRPVDQNGNPLSSGVENKGAIFANGGSVLVTAQAARGVLDRSVDMRGVVEAQSVHQQNGTIIITGDPDSGLTKVSAKLDASAGTQGIDGGFIETSGHSVDFTGIQVDTSAPHGKVGTWLIDPVDLTICSACTTTSASSGSTYSGGTNNSNLLVTDLLAALASSNVIVQTASTGTGGNGDIIINTDINWSSNTKLTLSAFRRITSNADIINTGGGSVVLQSDNTGTGNGTVSFAAGKNVTLSGGSGTVKIYYNSTSFGTQNTIYSGGTNPTQYMLINNLGTATDSATTASLGALSNNTSLWTKNFALGKDINATATSSWNSGAGFNPIGNNTIAFSGNFDGQGHFITGLTINRPTTNSTGFFGRSTGSIANVSVQGAVTGKDNTGLLVGDNAGSINSSFVNGRVIGNGSNVGGLVGRNSGSVIDTSSFASVNAASSANVGGLVGNNSNVINTSFATGMVIGASNVGGLIGTNSGTVSNSYFDTSTTGQTSSSGGTGYTTANMMLQATYSGFDFANTWGIISGKSYPYLKAFYPTTPRAISGIVETADPLTGTVYSVSNQNLRLVYQGSILDNTQTGSNGFYYFLEKGTSLVDGNPFLIYINGNTTKGTTVTLAPNSGASLTGINLKPNALYVQDNGVTTTTASGFSDFGNTYANFIYPTYTGSIPTSFWNLSGVDFTRDFPLNPVYNFISNIHLATVLGNLVDSNILYTKTAVNLNINSGFNFLTSTNLNYGLAGSITATNGSIVFGGPLQVGSLVTGPTFTVKTNTSGHIKTMGLVTWANNSTATLSLNSAQTIYLNKSINGILKSLNGTSFNSNGSLTLAAEYNPTLYNPATVNGVLKGGSITTGPLANIVTNNFILNSGQWFQNNLSILNGQSITLNSAFLANNKFTLNTASGNVQFIRVGAGNGSASNPYQVMDNFGLQGIGSDVYTLSKSYALPVSIGSTTDRIQTLFWGTEGFIPIGDMTHPFMGTFDGRGNTLGYQYINQGTSASNVGVFGVVGSTGTIKNVNFSSQQIIGGTNVGLIGTNYGTISNVSGVNGQISGVTNVGGLVGSNYGTITNAEAVGSIAMGSSLIGGLVGTNNTGGVIDKTLAVVNVYQTAPTLTTGGIAGLNNGTIKSSFWDVNFSGQTKPASNQTAITTVKGGCYFGNCPSKVVLTDPNTYLAAGWNLTNTWNVYQNRFYPLLNVSFSRMSSASASTNASSRFTVYQGTYVPDQLVLVVTSNTVPISGPSGGSGPPGGGSGGPPGGGSGSPGGGGGPPGGGSGGSGSSMSATMSSFAITGHDGSFAIYSTLGSTNAPVVFSAVGGGSTGTFAAITSTGGAQHLSFPTNGQTGGNYQFKNYVEILTQFAGVNYNNVVSLGAANLRTDFYNPVFIPIVRTVQASALVAAAQTNLTNPSYLSAYAQSLGNGVYSIDLSKIIYDIDHNMVNMTEVQQILDRQIMLRTDIAPDKNCL
jgi:filamentous hemagglutinin family protein